MNDKVQKNVFGEPLESCSNDPLTGWFRDGCCNTDKNDRGTHTVCAKVTDNFLIWSVVGIILGGRIGYVLFYQTNLYLNNPIYIKYLQSY